MSVEKTVSAMDRTADAYDTMTSVGRDAGVPFSSPAERPAGGTLRTSHISVTSRICSNARKDEMAFAAATESTPDDMARGRRLRIHHDRLDD